MPRVAYIYPKKGKGKYGPPKWDITGPDYHKNKRSQANAAQNKPGLGRGPRYFSDWKGMNSWLNHSSAYRADLKRVAIIVARELRQQIPYGEDGSDGHFRDSIAVMFAPRSNWTGDRQVFQVVSRAHRFKYANGRSGKHPVYGPGGRGEGSGTRWSDKALQAASRKRI